MKLARTLLVPFVLASVLGACTAGQITSNGEHGGGNDGDKFATADDDDTAAQTSDDSARDNEDVTSGGDGDSGAGDDTLTRDMPVETDDADDASDEHAEADDDMPPMAGDDAPFADDDDESPSSTDDSDVPASADDDDPPPSGDEDENPPSTDDDNDVAPPPADDDTDPAGDDDGGAGTAPPPDTSLCTADGICMDTEMQAQGLRRCNKKTGVCHQCLYSDDCRIGEYCDSVTNVCLKGANPLIGRFTCQSNQDCRDNPDAHAALLIKCDSASGYCVGCLDDFSCGAIATCDLKTHTCGIPGPVCDPPCGGDSFCAQGDKCVKYGDYCMECYSDADCINADTHCYKFAGTPDEVPGWCTRKCLTDSECTSMPQPLPTSNPSACYLGECICPL